MYEKNSFMQIGDLKLGVVFTALVFIAGCGGNASFGPGTQGQGSTLTLKGRLLGGQFPVQGAEVQLYAAGSSGYGTGAQALLSSPVTTDQYGNFTVTDFTCPSDGVETYIVSTGGNPGTGTDNPAIALMAALGPCSGIDSIPFVNVDEVTTVASVWALAPFIGPGKGGAQVGTSATNATGLANAFANVNTLVDITQGVSPGNSIPTNAVIPTAKIYSLANILAACVNSVPPTACNALFGPATPPDGTRPTNTIDAALDIALNPANNVAALYGTATPTPPFGPPLTAAPVDWTLGITYSGGGLKFPTAIAVDALGDVWSANFCGSNSACSVVTELSSAGQPLSPTGFTDGTLWENNGLAIDGQSNVWVTNEQTASANSGLGSLSRLNSSGKVISPAGGYFGGGVDFPVAVAIDTNGNVWTANQGDSTVSLLSISGTAVSPVSTSSGWGSGDGLAGPVAVAIDSAHNAWFADEEADSGSVTCVTENGNTISTIVSGGFEPFGIAVDASNLSGSDIGHVWVANYSTGTVSEIAIQNGCAATVTSTGYTGGGLDHPHGVAVDGAGNIWVTNYIGNSITELEGAGGTNPGNAISPPTKGYGSDLDLREPYGIAIDASGNVWVSNFGLSTITQLIGAAAPVRTPLLGPPHLP